MSALELQVLAPHSTLCSTAGFGTQAWTAVAAQQQSAALLTAVPAGWVLVALQCHTVSALQDPLDGHSAGLALLPALQGTRVQSSSAGRADIAAGLTAPGLVVVGYITVARQTAGVTTLQ